jgi:hypothetical protein
MTDLLLENQNARKLIKTLGLPIPVPEKLARAKGPYEERPLDDKKVLVCGAGGLQTVLAQVLAQLLTKAGATPWVVGDSDAVLDPYIGPGEAWARTPRRVEPGDAPEGERVDAIVFDGTPAQSLGEGRGHWPSRRGREEAGSRRNPRRPRRLYAKPCQGDRSEWNDREQRIRRGGGR